MPGTKDIFDFLEIVVNCTGLVVKRPGVLSKVVWWDLILGVGVLSLLPLFSANELQDGTALLLSWLKRRSGEAWMPST